MITLTRADGTPIDLLSLAGSQQFRGSKEVEFCFPSPTGDSSDSIWIKEGFENFDSPEQVFAFRKLLHSLSSHSGCPPLATYEESTIPTR